MRSKIEMLAALMLSASSSAEPKDYEVYTLRQSSISHSQPVSFSVGYPVGWTKTESGKPQTGELLTLDPQPVCTFWSDAATTNRASVTIFRALGGSAQEDAEHFASAVRQRSITYAQKRIAPIKTEAGDAGYLVVFEAHFEMGNAFLTDLFFHVGAKGALRISIMTRAEDATLHDRLQKLVLQTLQF
jgi:hypothetical protein